MRTFIFLCCVAVFGFSPNEGFSQNEKISITENKEYAIDEVFELIIAQTDYNLIYAKDLFENTSKISLNKGTVKVNKLLNKLLAKTIFTYDFTNDNTIILKKRSAFIDTDLGELAQRTITGTVTDINGNPMPAVNVLAGAKGSSNVRGVSTDFEGKFSITVSLGEYLKFTFLGYITQEIEIKDQKVIDVILLEDTENLEEIVITGYQRLSVNRSAGSTKAISGEVIKEKGNSNMLQSLEGQVAGLGFAPDPTAEGEKKFDIRGVTSLNGDSRPLIVVDGFPFEGDISSINPYEIESVHILKDAAATSIYGARAANGVVVITTKRGNTGQLNISYRSSFTTSKKKDLKYRLNRINSSDLIDIQEARAMNDDFAHSYEWLYYNYPYHRYFATAIHLVYETVGRVKEGSITQQEADALFNSLRSKDNTNQLKKYFLQSNFEHQHNISVSGGGEKNTFRTSLNYTENQHDFAGSESDRIIFDVLNNFKINDKINIDVIGNVALNTARSTPVDHKRIFEATSSYEDIIDERGNYLPVNSVSLRFYSNDYNVYNVKPQFEIQRLINAGLLDESYIPLKELGATTIDDEGISVRVQTTLNAILSKSVTGQLAFQYESGSTKSKRIASKESFEITSLINNTTPLSFTGDLNELNIPYGARVIESRGNRNTYTLRGQLDFSKTFDDHEVTAIVGSEIRNVFHSNTVTDRFGYDDSTLLFLNVDKNYLEGDIRNVYIPEGNISEGIKFFDDFEEIKNRFFSLYGNFIYGINNKYILSGSVRIDQSNLFGTDPEYRYKPFWSIASKWRLGEEDFIDNSIITKLDLRLSYGINGNISNLYGPFNIAESLHPLRAGRARSLEIVTPALSDLRWERTATTNIGLDVNAFDNKIALGLDYYIKKTDDLLANAKTNPTFGFSNLVKNDANITNKGLEVSLNTVNVSNKNFTWSSLLTFRHNKNKVTKTFSDEKYAYYAAGLRNYEGAPANTFWLFNYNGLNELGEGTITKGNGETFVLNNYFDPIFHLDMEDIVNAGTVDPKFSGAITNTFNYKNFGLSFMFIGNGGHVLFKDSYNGEHIGRNHSLLNRETALAWQQPGDEQVTNIPRYGFSTFGPGVVWYSTKNIIEGDYIKLREVILTYSLTNNFLKRNKISNVQFNVRGNNLFYFAKNKYGIDPEGHGVGVRYFPTVPVYTAGLTVNF